MKQLQLIDRVLVEIRGEEGTSERLSLVHIANELRKVAEQIENGMKGDEWVEEDIRTHEHREVLFEHECIEFGFRMGNKSLICMHYYGSEPKPKAISDELMDSIIEFNKDYDEQFEKIGEDIYTKTAFLEDAARLLSQVEQEKTNSAKEKYIIIAHNYDRENSDAYPVGKRIFATEEEAKAYLREHINDIKSDHWTADRVDGEGNYSEEFTFTGWEAHDSEDGSSLELTISQVKED